MLFTTHKSILIADFGLISKKNIILLQGVGYKYTIGACIRNESKSLREWVLGLLKSDWTIHEHIKLNNGRLIVSYTDKRDEKDQFSRDRGIKRLQQSCQSGR